MEKEYRLIYYPEIGECISMPNYDEGLRAYINHLLTETYKNKPYTCEAIKELAIKYDLS